MEKKTKRNKFFHASSSPYILQMKFERATHEVPLCVKLHLRDYTPGNFLCIGPLQGGGQYTKKQRVKKKENKDIRVRLNVIKKKKIGIDREEDT